NFELGHVTLPLLRICALRMRDNRSPSGSFIAIVRSSLPARLHETRDQPLRAKLPQRDARQFVLAVIAARPARYLAAVADAGGGRIARQFGKLECGGETLLHRLRFVARDRLEPRSPARKLLGHPAPPVVLLDRTLLRHLVLLAVPRLRPFAPHCRNGKLNAVNKARASSSLRAVVHTVISMPQMSAA